MKTALSNILLPTLFNVVNNTKQVVEPELGATGVTMLNNIVDNLEQCRQQFKHCSMLFSSVVHFLLCSNIVPESTARNAVPGVSPGRGLLISY